VELTMTSEPEGLTAVLLQLAGLTQKLTELDQRQAADTRDLTERVAAVAKLANDLKGTTTSHAEALAALHGQIADLAAKSAGQGNGDTDQPGYQPSAAPELWKPGDPGRDLATGCRSCGRSSTSSPPGPPGRWRARPNGTPACSPLRPPS
jgi:hypothetical protein